MSIEVVSGVDSPVGYEQITDLSSAAALTVPANARWAIIIAETQAVRWRDDGTDPSATVGMPLAVGQPFQYTGSLAAIRFFEQTANAKLNVSFYA